MIIITYLFVVFFHLTSTQESESGSYEIRELSLSRPYPTVFSTSNSHWDLVGNTLVTDKFIRLTSDAQGKAGGLWSNIPIVYPDWEVYMHFKIHGASKGFFGDGIAIWYVKEPRELGPVFGYRNYFTGLGIFLDTYANKQGQSVHTYPYISAIVNNGTLYYDHDNDGIILNAAGCEAAIRGRSVDTMIAVRYENDHLTVSTDTYGTGTLVDCFSLDVQLPTHYYLGFSAATGDLTDNHDIISVHTYALDSSEQRKMQDRKSIIPVASIKNTVDTITATSQSSSWSALKIFFLIVGSIILVLAVVFIYYYNQNRRRGPRFY